jgi:hypothetical protein
MNSCYCTDQTTCTLRIICTSFCGCSCKTEMHAVYCMAMVAICVYAAACSCVATHLHSHRAEGLIVLLCLLQRHLQLSQVLLEAIELHTNILSLLLSPLQKETQDKAYCAEL